LFRVFFFPDLRTVEECFRGWFFFWAVDLALLSESNQNRKFLLQS